MSVRLGYACISIVLRKEGVYSSHTLTLESLKRKGIGEAKKLALANIDALKKIIIYNEENGIRFFRITSNLFPHMENPLASKKYHIKFAAAELARAGELIRSLGHRVTMHPGQFAQLGSPNEKVVDQTFRDLTLHANIFECMGLTPEHGSVMIIHGGGSFGNKTATLARWEENFKRLPEGVRRFVALENDDYQYTVMDLLPICEKNGIPLCIDYFHHQCNGQNQFNIFDENVIQRVMNTWKLRGIKPKCHWSNQAEGMRKGAHGDYITEIPGDILAVCKEHGCDIMCECKMKDLCVLKLLERHYTKNVYPCGVSWELK